jgi:anti-sigma regulatory factor (Ser/Thr protein kinase)
MTVYIVCHRDPDSSNFYVKFPDKADIEIIDIDYGYMDLRDPEEFSEWKDSQLAEAEDIAGHGTPEALACADHIRAAVTEAVSNYGHKEES